MDTSNVSRGGRPIYGATANFKDAILIPKLKSSSLKRAVRLPVTLSSKSDGMRDLISVHILDQAAAALALSYIEEFELELITLRHRVLQLENLTSIQKYQDVTSATSFPNFDNLNVPNDATIIPLCESKIPGMASSFINQPAYACDDFLENIPPQTNEACLTNVVISATKTTLNCINPDAPLVRRSNRRASMSKSYTYPTPTKERSISEKNAQIKLKEGKSSVKVLENKTPSTAGTVFGNMSCRHQKISLNVSESIVTEVKELQKSPVASITNNDRTIIDSTGKKIFSFDYLRNDDEVNLDSVALWASPGLIQDSKCHRSDPRERCGAARENLVECTDYSTEVNLEGGISPPAATVWQESEEQSPEKYVGIMDYENAEAYGVLMFDSAMNNSNVPLDQESPGGKFNSEYASEVSMDDLLAHEDVFSSLTIVESNTSTTARRTSGRFCVKPKRYLNDIIHNKKTKGSSCQKKRETADLKKTSIQQEKTGNARLSFQLLRGEGYASGDNLLMNPDGNEHGNLTSMGVESEVMCDNVNVTPQKRHHVDDEYTAVICRVLKPDQEHSSSQYKQSTMAFLHYDSPSTSPMKSEEEQNWQQYVDFRDQDYEENCGVMSWSCDTVVNTSKPVCSSSSSKICSADVTTNQKISKDSVTSLSVLALFPSSQPTIFQRLCVVEKFIQSESTDELLRGATATSALRSARQILLDSPCNLSESNVKSTGMAFVTIFYSFISASAVASSISLPPAFTESILGIVKYFDCSIDETETTNTDMNSFNGKKSVRFCDVDGSSVTPPGKDCCHLPILRTMRRLHGLIGKIEIIVMTVQATHQIIEDPSTDNLSPVIGLILQCCVQLTDTVSAAAASRAVRESMSLSIPPGEVAALAGLIGSEIIASMKAKSSSSSLSGARTILRHRTAWMSTSVLRSQLRWLLDAPPAFVSVQSICPSNPINLSRRSLLHKMVSLCEGGDALSATASSKKKRRKSDITVIDHTTLHPVEMTLSSLLAHALRQIYDAITIVVDSSAGASQFVDSGYTDIVAAEFLTAAVTHHEGVNQVNAALDGMEHSHPQVIIKHTSFFIRTRFVCSCSFFTFLSISYPYLHIICFNYQLALAAIRANAFIRHLLTYPAVRECIAGEVAIWSAMSECASLISEHGMSEDRHLCLFAGGYEGLLRFSHCSLMSDEAEAVCTRHVSSLINSNSSFDHGCKADANDLAILLNESFIYDFPRLTAILNVV